MTEKQRTIIIDGYNLFVRSYIADPSLARDGSPIGGCRGFLKSLQKLMREIRPSQVIIAWDGEGGSRKRKSIHKEYKDGRAPIQLNRNIDQNLTEEETRENRHSQWVRLVEYLNELPVIQLLIEQVEADDIIGYLATAPELKGRTKIIISSDKDFYQLCDHETMVYRPIQNKLLNMPRIIEEFGIHPKNFAMARAIVGDKSDNIEGISGAGLPTVAKRFSFLSEDKDYNLENIFQYCENVENPLKLHSLILENKNLVKRNYKLMQLGSPTISAQGKNYLKSSLANFTPTFRKTEFLKMMANDGFVDYNWESLFQTCKLISRNHEAKE